ncbi:MAG TPA: hypothetical protein VM891_06295 [Amaricoccus sp.]|nr:hypothetical protein [Amaricoccus sp.]HVL21378.1 hypothetical protein [Amaricoccus sp.]HVL21386.1 hypothetical protein [Amaricoccus sp.]
MEDTRLACPRKLALLMPIVALALAWAVCVATSGLRQRSPRRKTHGYYEKSWFRTGFDDLRNTLRSEDADLPSLCKPFRSPRVV